MKSLVSILFIFLGAQVYFGQKQEFIEYVLDDFQCRDCDFVALDVFAGDFVGKVVVENDGLYSYLEKTEGFDKVRYKSHMKAVIAGGQPMVLRNAKIEKRGIYIEGKDIPENTFGVVRQFKDVDDIVSNGCETFIRYYFLGEELESIKASAKSCAEIVNNAREPLNYKRGLLDTSKRNSIISKLFEWQIPARIEDISNDLVLVKYEIKGSSMK